MPRLWRDTIENHRREVRGAILDTTASLALQQGLLSVTMSQIAEDTGIGRATLYKYFPDVETILVAWHEREITRHLDHLATIRDNVGGDALDRLRAVLETYADLAYGSRRHYEPELAALLHRGRQVAAAERRLRAMIRDLVQAAVEAGEIRDDVPLDELVDFGLSALGATRSQRSRASVSRLVRLALAGMAPGR